MSVRSLLFTSILLRSVDLSQARLTGNGQFILKDDGKLQQEQKQANVHLNNTFTIWGPFASGMREIPWHANPLEAYGNLAYLFEEHAHGTVKGVPSVYSWTKDGLVYPSHIQAVDVTPSSSSSASDTTEEINVKVDIAFSAVPWRTLRSTAGWTALQWQATGVSDLSVDQNGTYTFAVDKAILFAVVDVVDEGFVKASREREENWQVPWRNADIYSYDAPVKGMQQDELQQGRTQDFLFSDQIVLEGGRRYKVFVQWQYENRIFGDPESTGKDGVPVISSSIRIGRIEPPALISTGGGYIGARFLTDGRAVVVPDVVGGWLAGEAISVPIQAVRVHGSSRGGDDEKKSKEAQLRVYSVKLLDPRLRDAVQLRLRLTEGQDAITVLPQQTRPLALSIQQSKPIPKDMQGLEIAFEVVEERNPGWEWVRATVPIRHRPSFMDENDDGAERACEEESNCYFVFTYISPFGTVDYAVAIPPHNPTSSLKSGADRPVILGMHGAGVHASDPAWANAFRRQNDSWIILPSGGTTWGYDWQVRSFETMKAALMKQAECLFGVPPSAAGRSEHEKKSLHRRAEWGFNPRQVCVVGHSNGGQGAAYLMARLPDWIVAGVVAAGYVNLEEYVPFTWHQGRHFTDPMMKGYLDSSLSMFKTNLIASNLAEIPILWKYGAEDDNVPPHHSTTMFDLVQSWNFRTGANLSTSQLVRVPGRGHWWSEILLEDDVQNWIDEHCTPQAIRQKQERLKKFVQDETARVKRTVLSTYNTHEVASKNGWRIVKQAIPGRLSTMEVMTKVSEDGAYVHEISTTNVEKWHHQPGLARDRSNNSIESTPKDVYYDKNHGSTTFHAVRPGDIEEPDFMWDSTSRPYGPLIMFLKSRGPIRIILPSQGKAQLRHKFEDIAIRFASDSFAFGRIDCEILHDAEVLKSSVAPVGNMLILGGPDENRLFENGRWSNAGHLFNLTSSTESYGLISLYEHYHQQHRQDGLALVLAASDASMLERAAQLLPVRTGTAVPEFVVLHPSSGNAGTGAVSAAGWFTNDWHITRASAYLS